MYLANSFSFKTAPSNTNYAINQWFGPEIISCMDKLPSVPKTKFIRDCVPLFPWERMTWSKCNDGRMADLHSIKIDRCLLRPLEELVIYDRTRLDEALMYSRAASRGSTCSTQQQKTRWEGTLSFSLPRARDCLERGWRLLYMLFALLLWSISSLRIDWFAMIIDTLLAFGKTLHPNDWTT